MRVIKRCKPILGQQAAITYDIKIAVVLASGLILEPANQAQLEQWEEEYRLLIDSHMFRWKLEDWHDKGYLVIKKRRRPGHYKPIKDSAYLVAIRKEGWRI